MENAQRRESTFLMCVNKIIEFDSKVFKSEEDRMVRFHNCKFIAYFYLFVGFCCVNHLQRAGSERSSRQLHSNFSKRNVFHERQRAF